LIARIRARAPDTRPAWRRPGVLIGATLLLLQIAGMLFAPWITQYSPTAADPLSSLQPPSWQHLLGTDQSGMDVFSRIIYATRINLLIAVTAVVVSLLVGVPVGVLIGFYRGVLPVLTMRLFDFLQSFPVFVLGMALVSVLGQEIWNVAIVLAVLFIPMFARMLRAEVLSLRERPFISAARCSGATDLRIMFRHILPNAMMPVIVQISISIGMAILLTAGLSFIGAGVRMPTPEWGLMVATGAQQMILGIWWVALFPGLAIVLSVLSFGLLGDAIQNYGGHSRQRQAPVTPLTPQAPVVSRTLQTTPCAGAEANTQASLLDVRELSVGFPTAHGEADVLHAISFSLGPNEVLGLVGETGAGKSLLARSIIGVLPGQARITGGEVSFAGQPLSTLPEQQYRRLRGGRISLIGTNAKALLDPVTPVGRQIARVIRAHSGCTRAAARHGAVALLRDVGITNPDARARAYPHELSGGMAQRIVIAMALAGEPELILADDATLGLDATVQVQVLELLLAQSRARACAVILITHDLGIVARYCQRVGVMQGGRLIEIGAVERFLRQPQQDYSASLLAAARVRPTPADRLAGRHGSTKLLEVHQLSKLFPATGDRGEVRAVDGVDLTIHRAQTVALVGESGSGKTTAGQCLLHLLAPTGGQVLFEGADITQLGPRNFRPFRRRMQMVFQEPYVALNPRWRVADLIGEPFALLEPMSRSERAHRVAELLAMVHLPPHVAQLVPQDLTAGEQKRVGIARALATRPQFVVFDEPTTALDVTVRAQIIDLIRELQAREGLAALFITHDLNSVRSLAHHVVVMNRGRVVEAGETEQIFAKPADAYTRSLLAAELPIPQDEAHAATLAAG